ncbi:MAG: serine hydrolase, partial [Flavisolibacter sp.]|nr:serine hydrolase [Flavisolibacter sp.]
MKYIIVISFLFYTSVYGYCQTKNTGKAPLSYFPEVDNWSHKTPEQSGLNTVKLNEAILFAKENESKAPRNMEVAQAMTFGKEPFGEGIGPFSDRGDATGV